MHYDYPFQKHYDNAGPCNVGPTYNYPQGSTAERSNKLSEINMHHMHIYSIVHPVEWTSNGGNILIRMRKYNNKLCICTAVGPILFITMLLWGRHNCSN